MISVSFTYKEVALIAKLATGYRKSQEGCHGNKVEWAKKLEAKLVEAEKKSMETLTTNLKESYAQN